MPDYHAMQQDAIRRALEMQRRAKNPPGPPPKPEAPAAKEARAKSETSSSGTPGFFELLFRDGEKSLLLLLLLLLSEEGADPALLFALLYLSL